MNLKNKTIVIAAQFSPPYEGNFIPSLRCLASHLQSQYLTKVIFVFPATAKNYDWCHNLSKDYVVYHTGDGVTLYSDSDIRQIMEEKPALIYCHFEGYDKAFLAHAGNGVKFIWHMHDHLSFHKNPLKAAYQLYTFWRHYGKPLSSHDISLIAVNSHEVNFVRRFQFGKTLRSTVIINGMAPDRIQPHKHRRGQVFTFLAFGGRNVQKRIDLLLRAGRLLDEQGFKFKIIITQGTDTARIVNTIFPKGCPTWLNIVPQQKDVNLVFSQADCFVSCSIYETFSYAVAEATFTGMPIIQSDIDGTKWNSTNPSVLEFRNGSYKSLADKMKHVIRWKETFIQQMCAITASNNKANLSLEKWTDEIVRFINQI